MRTGEYALAKELHGIDIFDGLSDDSLQQIARYCSQEIYDAGECCAVEGETIDRILILNGGKVTINMKVLVARHTHTVTIATLTKGNVCAWSALVPPHVLTASIKCTEITPMTSIRAADLQRILEERPMVGYIVMKNLARVMSSRLRESHTQLVRLIAELIKQGK